MDAVGKLFRDPHCPQISEHRHLNLMSNDCIYIIDTFSLMFQVFHAIPAMTGTQGQPTNAVFGFTRDILAILDRKPTHLLCAFDSPGPGWRNELFDAYKANRSEMPEDLVPQIPLLKELLGGFRIPAIEHQAWEADDVIATVAARATAAGMDVVIVSSDKDIRQLLGPKVRLFNCRRNEFLDEAGLMADWGVRPDQVVDYQSLVGDAVDNVPGVPKIGPKTARALIEKFGSLDAILENSSQAPGKMVQRNLAEFADQARMSRELVRLRNDLPLELDLEDARVCDPDKVALFDLFTRLGFRRYASLMRPESADGGTSLAETNPGSAAAPGQSASGFGTPGTSALAASHAALISLQELATFTAATEIWNRQSRLFLDPVISGKAVRDRKLTSAFISSDDGSTWYLPGGSTTDHSGDLPILFLEWLSDWPGELITGDSKPLLHAIHNAKLSLKARLFDISIADYLLDAGARSHELSEVADRHAEQNLLAGTAPEPKRQRQQTMFDEDPADRSALSSAAAGSELAIKRMTTLRNVTSGLKSALASDQLENLYESLERPLIHVLATLEHTGIAVDVPELVAQSQKAAIRIEQLTTEVFAAAGMEFNIDSPKQLSNVLFQQLKLPVLKKTRTGSSTDQEVLEQLALIHPLPAKIIERRQLTKLRGTYLDTLPMLVHPATGRIHATFHQTVAATGRLSSSDPNLQNIPVRTEEGRQIRKAFLAGAPDWVLVCADYSQIELRVLAHFSRDQALTEAFRQGLDIHAAVAADVFQVPVEQVTSEQRRVAKAVNFGVIYGQSPFGLAAALNIDKSEAAHFIESYFSRYSGVARFCQKVLEDTVRTGHTRTIMNRRRAISGIRTTTGIQRNTSERTAINTVIQGSAADLIKKAMIEVSEILGKSSLRSNLLLQIHDELVFEVHQDDRDQLIDIIIPGMQNAMQLDVPLIVDVTSGRNWLEQDDVVR